MLKLIVRSSYRDRLYTFLNLAGLSVGFGCALVIFLYLKNELSYDQHFQNHEQIYRLTSEMEIAGDVTHYATAGSMVAPLLAQDYSQFEDFVRLNPISGNGMLLMTDDVSVFWDRSNVFYQADNSVFDIFSLDVLAGNVETALSEPRNIAISERMAEIYFGDDDPIGQTLGVQIAANQYTVSLVFADLPGNTSHRFEALFSHSRLTLSPERLFTDGIANFSGHTFFRLPADYALENFQEISEELFDSYIGADARQIYSGQNPRLDFTLQPLDEIYLSPALEQDVQKGNPATLYALSAVAVFVLGIASINFMNLSTARFTKRAREIGVRRTLGANRAVLVTQFLAEGVLFSLLALLIGVALVQILFSTAFDSALLGQNFSFTQSDSATLFAQLIAIGIAIGLISGAYPAFYFSSVKPITVFSPVIRISGLGINLRSILVGLQMLVSISVISGAMIMYQQVSFMKNKPVGFEKENKLIVKINTIANGSDYRAMMTELARHPDIYHVAMADEIPGTPADGESVTMQNDQGVEINMFVQTFRVDESYIDTFAVPLINGQNFPQGGRSSADVSVFPYLVNETLVKRMGWSNPIGKRIVNPAAAVTGEIVGVVADYNFSSLHQEISPQIMNFFYDDWRWQRYLVMDINPGNLQNVLTYVEGLVATIMPDTPFDYSFLDESLAALYDDEQRQAQLTMLGAGVSIVIAMLGLFGLMTFSIDQRTKEIGIRRVLGASVVRLLAIMFKGIFAVTVFAAIGASLMVFYALNTWLEGFSYRILISPMTFVIALSSVLFVSALTVAVHAIKIARDNPVNALRYE